MHKVKALHNLLIAIKLPIDNSLTCILHTNILQDVTQTSPSLQQEKNTAFFKFIHAVTFFTETGTIHWY